MGDLVVRGTEDKIIQADSKLAIKHKEIQLNEKKATAAGLMMEIEKLKSISLKRLELNLAITQKQIKEIEEELKLLIQKEANNG